MHCEKIDKYDYLIAMAALNAENNDVKMFENLDISDVSLSDRIHQKIEKLLKIERIKQKKPATKGRMVFSRVAVTILVVISVTFTAMMSVSAIRNAVWNAIIEWYDKYITVDYETDDPVLPPTIIENVRKPTLLPLGVKEEIVISNRTVHFSEYCVGDDILFAFRQSLIDSPIIHIDNETAVIKNVLIGNFEGILLTYEKNTDISLIWNDGEYSYTLTGYGIDADTMILIAESIK